MSRLRTLLIVSAMLLTATWLAYHVGHQVGSMMMGFIMVGVASVFVASLISPLITPQRVAARHPR